MAELHPDIERVVFSEEDIAAIVEKMGREITEEYADKNPLVAIDFMAVSSYGDATSSSGVVRILKDLDSRIEGRHVIIVEDILDSGLTLSYLINMLQSRGPASVEVAAFLVKDVDDRDCSVVPRFVGAHVPNEFIVGYGLDYAERYRNLPYIGVLKPECYS